jgi:flagellar biosynthetic protein FliQ
MFPDASQAAIDLARNALLVAMELALPLLLVGLCVGLCVSLFQALTQLQEQTLTFIPKILAVGGVMFMLLPWMLNVVMEFTTEMFKGMATVLLP